MKMTESQGHRELWVGSEVGGRQGGGGTQESGLGKDRFWD